MMSIETRIVSFSLQFLQESEQVDCLKAVSKKETVTRIFHAHLDPIINEQVFVRSLFRLVNGNYFERICLDLCQAHEDFVQASNHSSNAEQIRIFSEKFHKSHQMTEQFIKEIRSNVNDPKEALERMLAGRSFWIKSGARSLYSQNEPLIVKLQEAVRGILKDLAQVLPSNLL